MAATNVGAIEFVLDLNDKRFKKGINDVNSDLKGLGDSTNRLVSGAAAGLAVAGAAAVAFGVSSVKAFTESEDAIAQTNAVLKSTGGEAGVTAEMVDKLSSSLQNNTKFSDEQVRSAQNMLLTFTNIGRDIFPEATMAVADMAQAMGQDLTQTSIQVGKALQDPVQGVTALQRVGVRLTEDQKALVEQMVSTGDTAGAQKLILAELTKEFGGSAKAAGETFSGRLQILQNKLNDVQEVIGQKVVGAIFALGNAFQSIWEFLMRHKLLLAAIAGVLAVFAVGVLVSVITALGTLIVSLIATGVAWLVAFWPVILIGAAVGALAYLIISNWETLKQWFNSFMEWFKTTWATVKEFVTRPVVEAWELIKSKGESVINWFKGVPGAIKTAFGGLVNIITSPFKTAFSLIAKAWNNTVGKISFKAPDWVPGGLGGKQFSVPKVPEFRSGVENFSGGLAYVHRGEVLANLAPGTSVIKKSDVEGMAGGSKLNINIGQINSQQDADYLIQRVNRNYELAGLGMSPLSN